MISLTPKKPGKVITGFCEEENINLRHFMVPKFKDDVTISSSQVVQILQMIIDPRNLPVYIHCLDGSNITGLIIMCLRKLQNWNLAFIFTEFTRYTQDNHIASAESEFVETFKAEIEVGLSVPHWLWQGVRMTKHPTLKLKLLNAPAVQIPKDRKKREKDPLNLDIRKNFEVSKLNKEAIQASLHSRDLQALSLEGVSTLPNPAPP